jgi:hypothetical protein
MNCRFDITVANRETYGKDLSRPTTVDGVQPSIVGIDDRKEGMLSTYFSVYTGDTGDLYQDLV